MKIETVSDLIDGFGGVTPTAKALEVVPSAVTNWRRRGYVPLGHVLKVQRFAKRRRWKLADSLFELEG